jgi:type VI secretion system protein ImpG
LDPRLLDYYERELRYLREMGAEFAREFPKVAGRLGLEGLECADPYVERLLESFGFLAARVQLKIDAEFPRFTQHLLELVYPHYLAPTPSMVVVQLAPNLREGALAAGFSVPRDTVLRARLGKREQTACEYWTKHEVALWPLELKRVQYTTLLNELADIPVAGARRAKAVLSLQLATTAGLRFDQLSLDRLPLYLAGGDEIAMRLYEQLSSAAFVVIARPTRRPTPWYEVAKADPAVRPLGFDDHEALLPYGLRSFQGYRLLHEYFAFPSRYMFIELSGLAQAVRRCRDTEIELLVLLDRAEPSLEGAVDASRLLPFCTPAVNLFPRQADRIHLTERENEYHVVPDRTRPMDLEVHSPLNVMGYGIRSNSEREFLPLYAARDQGERGELPAYYTISRQPRMLSGSQRSHGARSTYVGSEVFISLVDAQEGPFSPDLRQLGVQVLCTNRDLPLHMSVGQGNSDFTLQSGAPVDAVRCVAGPSAPRPSHAHGDVSWRLISHLALNYLSLTDSDGRGASALRELLALYADLGDPATRKQVHGVRSVKSRAVTRPLPGPGPISFGRGVEVNLECDETAFQGSGVFLLAAVLERFFAKYVSINSFTETVLTTLQRGEVTRWPMTSGQRPVL